MSNPQVEKVAEALWLVDHPFAAKHNVTWADVSNGPPRDRYRRMAQAAIDALELTDEWAVAGSSSGAVVTPPTVARDVAARKLAVEFNHCFALVPVGPWVRCGDTPAPGDTK